jgi:transcriptional activator SPT8
MARRTIFTARFPHPPHFNIDAVVAIPHPAPVHSLASTACLSYLLTGSQEGFIRAYDIWASVRGDQLLTTQQKTAVGIGEIAKNGVGRGWWSVEVPDGEGGRWKEPVYSLACEADGVFTLAGTMVRLFSAGEIRF